MGLLDSVLGAALGGSQQQQGGLDGLGNILGGMLGGGQPQGGAGGLGDILGSVLGGGQQQHNGINIGALLPVVIGMLANRNGGAGASGLNGIDGLGGLMNKFNQAGMGDVINSWVGGGQNQPISGDQLSNVLGGDLIGQIAAHLGASNQDAAGALAQVLPNVVDKLTPQGQAPQGGFGSADDLVDMLGRMLQK